VNDNATGLTLLILLALGTFVSGVHARVWRICLVGVFLGLGVPTVAWVQDFATLLLVGIPAVGGGRLRLLVDVAPRVRPVMSDIASCVVRCGATIKAVRFRGHTQGCDVAHDGRTRGATSPEDEADRRQQQDADQKQVAKSWTQATVGTPNPRNTPTRQMRHTRACTPDTKVPRRAGSEA